MNNGIRAAVYMILHQLTNDDEQIVNNQLVDCLKKVSNFLIMLLLVRLKLQENCGNKITVKFSCSF